MPTKLIEAELSDTFFKKFFVENWDKELAKKLELLGEPFKKAIRVLGVDKKSNPILGFMLQDFAKDRLTDGSLNALTFKAIYNAVAKKLVADSEFFKTNKYNIIYCKDLYNKSAAEIEKYLIAQKDILNPSAHTYTVDDVVKNKLVFFNVSKVREIDVEERAKKIKDLYSLYEDGKLQSGRLPSATNPDTTLNSLSLSAQIKNEILGTYGSGNSKNSSAYMSTKAASAVASQLKSPAECFAIIQHFSLTTDVVEAKQALKHEKFRNLSGERIAQATEKVSSYLNKGTLPDKEVKALIAAIIDKLE